MSYDPNDNYVDPSTRQLLNTWAQETFGVSSVDELKEAVSVAKAAQQDYATQMQLREVALFHHRNPSFPASDANAELMMRRMQEEGRAVTFVDLEFVYSDLQREGKLQPATPASAQPTFEGLTAADLRLADRMPTENLKQVINDVSEDIGFRQDADEQGESRLPENVRQEISNMSPKQLGEYIFKQPDAQAMQDIHAQRDYFARRHQDDDLIRIPMRLRDDK